MTAQPTAKSIHTKALRGTAWSAIDRFGNLAIQFLVNMVLAWLLTPDDFAIVAILNIFISVSATLLDGGFSAALIQAPAPTQTDFSTIFIWNLGISVTLYGILWMLAPVVGRWFAIPELRIVLRGIGSVIIFNALSIVQTVRLRRTLNFRILAISNLAGIVSAGTLSVIAAYQGYGVWSLVILTVMTALIRTIVLWIVAHWHPSLSFSIKALRALFGFGGFMVASDLLQSIANNIQGIIIGRRIPIEMGYYNQAQKLDNVTSYTIPNILVNVLFPYFTKIKDNRTIFCRLLARNIRIISLFTVLVIGVLIWIAPSLIALLYGQKWLPAAPYFRIFCVGGIFVCLQNINYYAVASTGHSRDLFFWSFYKWGMLLGLVMTGSVCGITGILWGMVISNFNIFIVNAFLVGRHVGYALADQLRDILPGLMCGLGAMAVTWLLCNNFNIPEWFSGLLFAIMYLCTASLLRLNAFCDAVHIISHRFHN